MNLLDDLVKVMTLERLEVVSSKASRDIGSPQVFGGQVLGQALVAATATVEERIVHSLHAYFLRRGDFNSPIVYEVKVYQMDGKHFASLRPSQSPGQQIFGMSASFQSPESGLDHQAAMPAVRAPEDLIDLEAHYRLIADRLSPAARRVLEQRRPFEFRPVQPPPDPLRREKTEPLKYLGFRGVGTLPDDEALHRLHAGLRVRFPTCSVALRPLTYRWQPLSW